MSVEIAGPVGGRYQLGERIARLSMGELFEARDLRTSQQVLLHVSEMEAGGLQMRSINQRLLSLQHRNLPRVRDLVESQGKFYSVQDEFRGRRLDQIDFPLAPELARRYLRQILDALDYLHTQNPPVVHRDLRPETVLVAPHGSILLSGLDVARMLGQEHLTTVRLQRPSAYVSLAQIEGEPSEPSQDLYSAGAVGYFVATGKAPASALERLSGGRLVPLPPELPRDLRDCIEGLMEGRFATARQALGCLEPPQPRLPERLLREAPAVATAPVASEAAAEAPETLSAQKRSMWQLLFGKKKEEQRPHAAPEENSPEVQQAQEGYEFVDLPDLDLDPAIAHLLPEPAARSAQGVCIGLSGTRDLILAVKDPTLVYIYDNIDVATHGRYRAVLRRADPLWIDRALDWAYRNRSKTDWRSWVQRRALDQVAMVVHNPMADISSLAQEITHPVVEATERVIKEAISVGTSDIHMETFENRVEVRYRIDGVLQSAGTYPRDQGSSMIKRIKVMANMDVSQERITQGGRISLELGDRRFDLRVSVVPVARGESVVMRVLKKGSFDLTLSDLGIDPDIEKRYRAGLSQPHGIILVCGPTGSGKSTTLYASLKELMRPDRKLLTVEDPVEYDMDGLIQVQVNMSPKDEEMRVSFAKVLREFLRHDPEVVLVGEIRDQETAQIALQASLTGHLVLSTLHTNDSVGIISRLRDMGSKSFLIGSTLKCGLAQRLARRVCPECRQAVPVTEFLRQELLREGVAVPEHLYLGSGCRACMNTGYVGRIGLYELMEVTAPVRSLISSEATEGELLAELRREGFRSLYQNGLDKVAAGVVSYEEVQRVCQSG